MRYFIFILIGAALLALDVVSKAFVHDHFPLMGYVSSYPYGGVGVFKNLMGIQFSLVHAANKGMAWGLFASFPRLIVMIRLVLLGLLLLYVSIGKLSWGKKLCLTLAITGAVGNVVDSFLYGHVIDLFYFIFWGYSYPIFNIADAAIFLGAIGLFLLNFRKKKQCQPIS